MKQDNLPQSLLEAVRFFASEDNCHDFLVSVRWADGVRCAHCESDRIGKLVISGKRRLWNCKACKSQFTAKVGTIFQDSPLGLDKWLPAVWMICNAKNGVSSHELGRSLDITQKSAWHMGHRIRTAMKNGGFVLSGEVEGDETYIGGKAGNMHKHVKAAKNIKTGFGAMTPVAGLLQRSTETESSKVKLTVLNKTRRAEIIPNVLENVKEGSALFTDAHSAYTGLAECYGHEVVDHAIEYVRGRVHTNGLENFWSLLKRTLRGTYVQCDPEHLFRYLDEQVTRFNERTDNDCGRFVNCMERVSGRRLTWRNLTS